MLLIKTCRTFKTKSVRVLADEKGHFFKIKHPTDCDYIGIVVQVLFSAGIKCMFDVMR